MLCRNNYPQAYIDDCRAQMKAQLKAYQALATAAKGSPALAAFESLFFNHLVVGLDAYFTHRSRTLELKDGNPANEVRMLCNSILLNHAVLTADNTIRYKPGKSILKLQLGDKIKLTEANFVSLSKAFFAEIEKKFSSPL